MKAQKTLNVEEARAILREVSERTIRRWCGEGGKLQAKKVGKSYEIDPDSVEQIRQEMGRDSTTVGRPNGADSGRPEAEDMATDAAIKTEENGHTDNVEDKEPDGQAESIQEVEPTPPPPAEDSKWNGQTSEPNDDEELADLFQRTEKEPPTGDDLEDHEHADDVPKEPLNSAQDRILDETRDELEVVKKTVEKLTEWMKSHKEYIEKHNEALRGNKKIQIKTQKTVKELGRAINTTDWVLFMTMVVGLLSVGAVGFFTIRHSTKIDFYDYKIETMTKDMARLKAEARRLKADTKNQGQVIIKELGEIEKGWKRIRAEWKQIEKNVNPRPAQMVVKTLKAPDEVMDWDKLGEEIDKIGR